MSQHARTRSDIRDNQDAATAALSQTHPALEKLQFWAFIIFGVVWLLMLLAAPILLALTIFGINYTVQWLYAGVWLIGITIAAAGVYLLVAGLDQLRRGGPRRISALLYGSVILLGCALALFLIWYGTDEGVSPLLILGLSYFLGIIFIGWGIHRLLADLDLPVAKRFFSFLGAMCHGIGLILAGTVLKGRELDIDPEFIRFLSISRILPLGLVAMIFFVLADHDWSKKLELSRQSKILLGILLVAATILIVLLVQQYFE